MDRLRALSRLSPHVSLCRLSRKVLQMSGKDSVALLQGLTTNDMYLLDERKTRMGSNEHFHFSNLYTLLLSVDGRVLFDTIVHRRSHGENPDTLYVEVDHSEIEILSQHLKKYKMRKKVDLQVMEDSCVYACLTGELDSSLIGENYFVQNSPDFVMGADPRAPSHGLWRIVTSELLEDKLSDIAVTVEDTYRVKRYQLGIPEGPREITRSKALPLNHNVDVMSGVCFSKGCYLGQELTARTHHTGVIRRRVFPVKLSKPIPGSDGPSNLALYLEEDGSKMGNLICTQGVHGLAMLKVDHAFKPLRALSDTAVTPTEPFWFK